MRGGLPRREDALSFNNCRFPTAALSFLSSRASNSLKRVEREMTRQKSPWMQGPEGRPPNVSPARKGWEIDPEGVRAPEARH